MAHGRIVAICQYGGEFAANGDGSLTYTGGDAHIIDIDHTMPFDTFKSEIAGLFGIDSSAVSIKYFLPNNRRTLITVSSDKDLKRMINFHANSETTDVYILNKASKRYALLLVMCVNALQIELTQRQMVHAGREIEGTVDDSGAAAASADRNFGQHKVNVGRYGNR